MQEHPFRLALLVSALVLAIVCSPPLHKTARHGWRVLTDLFDGRPARAVLIVGNSRVYSNDMPSMLRTVADAAGDPVRWDVTSLARSGATFESHWNDPDVHALLARRWDQVILQAESGAQWDADRNARFHRFGRQLVLEARRAGSPVAVVVGWIYGDKFFEGYPGSRDRMDGKIQQEHRRFSEDNGVDLINVGRVWRRVESARPELALTVDGNHPSLAGSYLEALAIHRYLADQPIFTAPYRPGEISAPDAEAIVDQVERLVSPRLRLKAGLSP